jgi:outer membrane protein TolC
LAEVFTARRDLQEAELDAAKTREDRIAVLEEQLEIAKQSVSLAERMFESGRVSEIGVLREQAALLSVEIELLREPDVAAPRERN